MATTTIRPFDMANGNSFEVAQSIYYIQLKHQVNKVVIYSLNLFSGNTTSSDLGGCPNGTCDSWFGPSGRDNGNSDSNSVSESKERKNKVEDLLPLILSSPAGQAFEQAGFPIDEKLAREMQILANLECDENGGDDEIPCDAFQSPCLFNIEEDPCEKRNLAQEEPETVEFLVQLIDEYNQTAIPPLRRWNDPDCAPFKWDYTWTFFNDLV
jgi:hypothetical protein